METVRIYPTLFIPQSDDYLQQPSIADSFYYVASMNEREIMKQNIRDIIAEAFVNFGDIIEKHNSAKREAMDKDRIEQLSLEEHNAYLNELNTL